MKYRSQTNTMLACAQSWSPSRQLKISQFKGMYVFIQFKLWQLMVPNCSAKAVRFSCSRDTDIFSGHSFFSTKISCLQCSTIIYWCTILKRYIEKTDGNKNRSETHVLCAFRGHDARCGAAAVTGDWRGGDGGGGGSSVPGYYVVMVKWL